MGPTTRLWANERDPVQLNFSRTRAVAGLAMAVAVTTAACQADSSESSTEPTSTASATPTPAVDVDVHESGPDSPLGYGLSVPRGAVQLGPLVRIRSQALIDAYLPELTAAKADAEALAQAEAAENAEPGETPSVPTPTPDDPPSDDTFKILEDLPRPDTVISVMRIDGDPSAVVRRMLAQIAALLPESEVPTDDLTKICSQKDQRVTGCRFEVRGLTADDRDVRIVMTADPGDVATRTAPPSAQRSPVMTLQLTYAGDPRLGQQTRESNDLEDVENIKDDSDTSGLIWPRMDLDAPATTKLAGGWVAPEDVSILLAGYRPAFAELTVADATTGDTLARTWVADRIEGRFDKDVVEDLNEVSTSYFGSAKDGTYFRATHTLSARGNYVLLRVYPAGAAR